MISGPIFGVTFLVALGVIFCQSTPANGEHHGGLSRLPCPLADRGDHHRLLHGTFPPIVTPALLPRQILTPPRARARLAIVQTPFPGGRIIADQ
jgi:hypothetical protein